MTQHDSGIELRRMEKRDLQQVLDLINTEGWEYDLAELDRILRIDPISSVVVCKGEIVIGGITVVVIGGRCVLGHAIVRDGWRRKGLGNLMVGSVLEDMEARGIDFVDVFSVNDAIPFYRKHGFEIVEEWRTYVKRELSEEDCAPVRSNRIHTLDPSDLPQMVALDRRILGFERHRIMENPNIEDGQLLLRALFSAKKPGCRVIFGLSEKNKVARDTLATMGFKNKISQFRLVRSSRKAKEFSPGMMAICAFELG
jgi:N-acetylglutamate synthase-like GNAT family acetyltransferase